ncbi:hypothetical protein BST97_04440 [Nonlabens spongiae]|uniref:Big-1 domain-containing protein n=1 Tax=Nonlabens spongiae TaxID=331648 RepID=A0A1W6MIK7_9FLAO|nr:Ig-like domain-containing protein [Nonlabens spongiae]ARN77289.1 hypothetical protein BST97_04440 [Nonlabens spongiae]
MKLNLTFLNIIFYEILWMIFIVINAFNITLDYSHFSWSEDSSSLIKSDKTLMNRIIKDEKFNSFSENRAISVYEVNYSEISDSLIQIKSKDRYESIIAPCSSCDFSGSISGNFTFQSNQTYCITSNSTVSDVTFQNNTSVCVAPNVTLTIQNNINSSGDINFNVEGTLIFGQSPQFNAGVEMIIGNNGIVRAGSNGNNNITFNGTTNTFINNGLIQVTVLGFQNGNSTNTIFNYDEFDINGNINISGITSFRNFGIINIGQSFNNSSQGTFSNCNIINTQVGFNLNGGAIYNTGIFRTLNGNVDFGNGGARFENYATMEIGGTLNFGNNQNVFYNEGLAILTNSVQGTFGQIEGPSDSNKLGYIKWDRRPSINSGVIGPNLDIEYRPGATPAAKANVYQNFNGTEVGNVSKACEAFGNCTAPQEITGDVCRNINGSVPTIFMPTQTVMENNSFTSVQPTLTNSPGGTITYSLSGDDAALFTINSSTGVVSMVPRDFENPVDSDTDNFYDLILTGTTSLGGDVSDEFTVIVNNDCEEEELALMNKLRATDPIGDINGDTGTLQVEIVDETNTPRSGVQVILFKESGPGIISNSTGVTDAFGHFSTTVTSTLAGVATYSARYASTTGAPDTDVELGNPTMVRFLTNIDDRETVGEVGIATNFPHPSSVLEVYSEDKGLLVPKVALLSSSDTATIPRPVNSLLVYNTNGTNSLSEGFVFFDGTEWKSICLIRDAQGQ